MSLAVIQYPPPTDQGWEEWLHAHVRHHEALIAAINRTFKTTLSLEAPLWPVDMDDKDKMAVWNRAHLDAHNAMNSVLGIPGQDISTPDFKNQRSLDAWLYTHFNLHQVAAQRSGEPI